MQENACAAIRGLSTIIVEETSLLRKRLTLILSAAGFDIRCAAQALDAETVAAVKGSTPGLLIIGAGRDLDATMEQVAQFKRLQKDGLVAVLIDEASATLHGAAALFKSGADACLSKDATDDVLVRSLELLALGQRVVPQTLVRALAARATPPAPAAPPRHKPTDADVPTPPLSAQEKRILRCLVDGHSNKGIARRFDIAEATVKVHLKAILRKIRLQNRTQAAIWALNNAPALHNEAETAAPPQAAERKSIAA